MRKEIATVRFKAFKRDPGWYAYFGGPSPSDSGKFGPYKTPRAAARSARLNGFATRTERKASGRR